jgi:hypothetical protein
MSARSFQTAERLVGALRRLLASEEIEIRRGSGLRVRALQSRITPLVATLARLAADSPEYEISRGVQNLLEQRRRNTLLMRESLGKMRQGIDARSDALARIRVVGPAYGPRASVASRLDAVS